MHTNDVFAWKTLPYLPAPHAVQTAEVLAAIIFEYVPAIHNLHALMLVVKELYNPAAHAVHTNDVVA